MGILKVEGIYGGMNSAGFTKKDKKKSGGPITSEEMDPVVSPTIAPAQELSSAYRYI